EDFLSFLDHLPVEAHPIIVDRRELPITDLPGIADGVILWGGNSLVELALLKIPTMVCGRYGAMDCPVGFATSSSASDLEDFLAGRSKPFDLQAIYDKTLSFLS